MKSFFELREEKTQVTVGDYTTKHFDMCPSAVKLYSKIKNMTVMVHLIVENMMLHDVFFRLEKQAVAQGAIDEDDLEKAQEYADLIMDNARQMGLEKEHSYIEDVHMPKFDKLAGVTGDEEDMNEKTLTPAELKKREEIAKSIERDNPNMPMGKKMAIATATAKRVAEAQDPGEYDYEGDMAKNNLRTICRSSGEMIDMLDENTNLPEWVQSKITLAEDYISSAYNYMMSESEEMDESADAGLAAKASKSGISIGTLRKVYRRGVAAWNSGHRPGTTPQQWGMARVNSYIGKGSGTYHGADKDLHEGDTSSLPRVSKDKESGLPKKYVAGLSTSTAKARAAHFNKMDKKSDRDPSAYEPAPGDANAKTKPSKHTLKYRAMFGEDMDESHNPAQQAAIAIAMKKAGKKSMNAEVKESMSTDKLKVLARAGLVDQKNVERLISAFKMLEAGKVLNQQQKDLILSSYGELASIVTGDSQTFQKAKKAVAEAVFREE